MQVNSDSIMKAKRSAFRRSYLRCLRKHLDASVTTKLSAAHGLGERAMLLGIDTLDLAKVHEQTLGEILSLVTLVDERVAITRCAALFFAEAIVPIEQTHRGALESRNHLKVMIATLTRRTKELADSNEELKAEILQRKAVEDSLRTSEQTTSQLLQHSRAMQEELRLLSRRLLSVQEEERKRISRELHDVIAQALTGINVRLATLKKQTATNTKDFHKKIEITQRLVEKSVDMVHRFARDLRPAVLDDLGLIPALQAYLKGFLTETGIRVSLKAFAGVEQLENAKRTVLYRVAQEALSNVAQHAHATVTEINIHKRDDCVCMEIHDNGTGFVVDAIVFAKKSRRLGLLGMRERVEMVGGTFCVESTPVTGTTVLVSLSADQAPARRKPSKSNTNTPIDCP